MSGELSEILPCASCGSSDQKMEESKPEGRTSEVYRVVCSCGDASAMWSVTPSAAVRLWNRYMAETSKAKYR